MQSNVLNDLAKAKRRWTEKKVQENVQNLRNCDGLGSSLTTSDE